MTSPNANPPGDETRRRIDQLSPDKLLQGFTRTRLPFYLIVAVLAHVLIIGGTSVTTIYGWIDPAWAEAREQARRDAQRERRLEAAGVSAAGEQGDAAAPTDPAAPDADAPADPAGPAGDAAADPAEAAEDSPDQPDDLSPIERQIRETAEPPTAPDDDDVLNRLLEP